MDFERALVSLTYAWVPAQPCDALMQDWLPRLPPAKRQAILKLQVVTDRNASLLGLCLLDRACRQLGRPVALSELQFPERGKPFWPGGPDFSVSHADGLVACAVISQGRIGLDLEPAGAVAPLTLRRVCTDEEMASLQARGLTPTDGWVMKEAAVKQVGRGIGALASARLNSEGATIDGVLCQFIRVELADSHVTWLAVDRGGVGIETSRIDVKSLLVSA